MSWDKNTYNMSHIDEISRTLTKLKIHHAITILGKVKGMGMNDTYDDKEYYELRKLEYKDTVILEKMHRTTDCDTDDVIMSHEFKKSEEPKDWELEKTTENS